jgi:hypothetical protein
MAVEIKEVAAKTKPSDTAATSGALEPGSGSAALTAGSATVALASASALRTSGSNQFNGNPTSRCTAAHTKHATRQSKFASSSAVTGHPTVLANPAIKVTPVMLERASFP